MHHAEDSYDASSEPTATAPTEQEEDLFSFDRQGRVNTPAPHVPYMSTKTQTGWEGRPYGPKRPLAAFDRTQKRVVIWHDYYAQGHFIPDCVLPVR